MKAKIAALIEKFKQTLPYQKCKKLIDTMRPMTWQQRIDYLWFSYKEIILIVAAVLFLTISITVSIARNDKETIFGGSFINIDMKQTGIDYMQSQLLEKLGGDPETQQVELIANRFEISYSELDYNYNMAMSTFSYIEAGILDYIIGDELAMEWYISDEIYIDLTMIFSKEELAEMEENLIYAQPENTQNRYPIAIKITDTDFAKDNLQVKDDAYLMFVGPFELVEQYHDFYEYLMAWESKEPEESTAAS